MVRGSCEVQASGGPGRGVPLKKRVTTSPRQTVPMDSYLRRRCWTTSCCRTATPAATPP